METCLEKKMNAIEHIVDILNKNKERDFLIDSCSGERLTFKQLADLAASIAQDLTQRGLKKGDRVAVILENSIETALIYFGCLFAGMTTVPINIAFSFEDINFILEHSGASCLVLSRRTLEKINMDHLKRKNIKILQVHNLKEEKPADPHQATELWPVFRLPSANQFEPFRNVSCEDTLTIIYTSGTTAKPKGVVHKIASLIDNARMFAKELDINTSHRFYGILSMMYLGGYYNLLLLPFSAGASVVLSKTFDAQLALDFWKGAKKYNVNTLWLVPSILSILLKVDRSDHGETFCRQNIKCSLIGTAPLPVKVKKDFEKRYGVILYENYGLSETLFISTNSPRFPQHDGSVGKILPGVQVAIWNDQGQSVQYGEEGEIFVRSPYLMKGYYNAQTQTPDHLKQEAWFATGDIGILDQNGDLFITGRKKDLIIRGGINISPAAIENILNEHVSIERGVVVGVPHEIYGEDIAAVVKLKAGYKIGEMREDLKQFCNKRLGDAQKLGHVLEIDEFPLGATGKVLKNQVRELVVKKLKVFVSDKQGEREENAGSSMAKKSLMIPGQINPVVKRIAPKVLDELKKYSTSMISDCLNRMQTMDGKIQPLVRGRSFGGSAVTVEEVEGGNLMSHAALELLQEGDVLVIDAKGITTRTCWGGLQTLMAKLRGASGIVIFGSVRDYEEIAKSGLPVYCVGTSPAGPLKGWGGNVNCPISCAGCVVNPGDIIIGDDDGVVVVPLGLAEQVIPLCEKRAVMEKGWFKNLEKGKSTLDIVGLRETLNSFFHK